MKKLNWIKICIIISIAFHLIAAILGEGFLHFDEHFQIIEFANFKLGRIGEEFLTTEYHHKMRPWLQPAIFYYLVKILGFLNIDSPHQATLWFRIISSFLGLISLFQIGKVSLSFIPKNSKFEKLLIPLLSLTWFYPYFHARGSSDNWGSIFFIIGFANLFLILMNQLGVLKFTSFRCSISPEFIKKGPPIPKGKLFLIGLLFGLSFEFRFQMGICIFFLFVWLITIGKISFNIIFPIAFGVLLLILIGVGVDSWGHGHLVFTPFNYLHQNLIVGMAGSISRSPWWDYFRLLLFRGYPPLSLVLILGVIGFWIYLPKNPITWVTLPFFLIHSAIGHKELRFLMPIIFLSPIMIWILINFLAPKFSFHKISTWIWKPLIVMNLTLLLISSFRPARVSVKFYRMLWNHTPHDKVLFWGDEPFTEVGAKMEFYRPPQLKLEKILNKKHLDNLLEENMNNLMVSGGTKLNQILEKEKSCSLEYLTYPKWFLDYNLGGWMNRSTIWAYFNCNKKEL